MKYLKSKEMKVLWDITRVGDLLRDYYRMGHTIGRDIKKYPTYLRSMHDIIQVNFETYKREYDEILFEKLVKVELEYDSKDYCIVVPHSSKDIVKEGTNLNHCVGSYVDRILQGDTYIMFMRKTNEKEKSLITLELRGNKILQAKGSYNRIMNEEERKFLDKYCKLKKIEVDL
jgi:hypothetical protein